jgi:hypothetical protein
MWLNVPRSCTRSGAYGFQDMGTDFDSRSIRPHAKDVAAKLLPPASYIRKAISRDEHDSLCLLFKPVHP